MSPPFQRVMTLDWETAWCRKSDFTLTKMSTEEYLRDPRFKPWGLCYHYAGDPVGPIWIRAKDLRDWVESIDWSVTATNSHNAIFDVGILAWHFGKHPAFVFDTLSMARALRGKHAGNSLAKLATEYEWPAKGNAVYSTDGILDELPFVIEQELADYCRHDVRLGELALAQFLPGYPKRELRLIDMTIRMFTKPVLRLDQNMMVDAISEEKERREGLLQRLGIEESTLASNDKFAEVLRALGVEPPTKRKVPTKKTPHPVGVNFAFAKSDALFQQLLNGDSEDVALACEARLAVKSTQQRTRAQRFADIASRGTLPVPLNYYAAHPGRWGGCLVAETEILVYDRHNGQCTKRIVDVLPDDLVWDGVDFVQHDGVKFSGYKEVITHDGVTGTPEHKVFLASGKTRGLAAAFCRGEGIMDAGEPDAGAVGRARALLKRNRW